MKDHNNNANQIEYLRRPGAIHISNIANNNQNSSKLIKISETLHEKCFFFLLSTFARVYMIYCGFAEYIPEWNSNCCLHSHVLVSHTMAVLSTLPLRRRSPFLFHFRENIGPLCFTRVFFNSPAHFVILVLIIF